MLTLGIETSCDETSVAVTDEENRVRSMTTASSQDLFEKRAGVIPEEAARKQVECMIPVLDECLRPQGYRVSDMGLIAVTRGPGLMGSLLTGTTCARTLSSVFGVPVIGVHHVLGHLFSTELAWGDEEPRTVQFPCLTLSASGGHTELWYRTSHLSGRLIGKTRDDAAGEAYDKGAATLGLPYPGGPSLAAMAEIGDKNAFLLPLPLRDDPQPEFSFSGLKTSLRTLAKRHQNIDDILKADMCASYQKAINDHLCDAVKKALSIMPETRELHVTGGVSANRELRREMTERFSASVSVKFPHTRFCGDNAAMIAAAGNRLWQNGRGGEFTVGAALALSQAIH